MTRLYLYIYPETYFTMTLLPVFGGEASWQTGSARLRRALAHGDSKPWQMTGATDSVYTSCPS
jgi:hypothetical protein